MITVDRKIGIRTKANASTTTTMRLVLKAIAGFLLLEEVLLDCPLAPSGAAGMLVANGSQAESWGTFAGAVGEASEDAVAKGAGAAGAALAWPAPDDGGAAATATLLRGIA